MWSCIIHADDTNNRAPDTGCATGYSTSPMMTIIGLQGIPAQQADIRLVCTVR